MKTFKATWALFPFSLELKLKSKEFHLVLILKKIHCCTSQKQNTVVQLGTTGQTAKRNILALLPSSIGLILPNHSKMLEIKLKLSLS